MSYYGNSSYQPYSGKSPAGNTLADSNKYLTRGELQRRYASTEKISKKDRQGLLRDFRDIRIGTPEKFFADNTISTTKYTLYNFFFKNLFEQFTKMANVYFLFLAFLQVIPEVTTSNGIPTYLPPLLFIVLLTMVKDAYEDYKRYKSDQEENNKETLVYTNGSFETAKWKDVRVGDVLKVVKDQFFPADMVMLSSSLFKKGLCFIETKNLDGETNLKNKAMCDDLKGVITSDQQVGFIELDSLSSRQHY